MARYTIKDVEYVSVTEVTGQVKQPDGFMYWACECMEKYILKNLKKCNVNMGQTIIDTWIFDIISEGRKYHKEKKKEAGDIGIEIHNMASERIKHLLTKTSLDWKGKYRKEVENGYLAFLEWEKKNVEEYIESELVVCESIHYGYAGRLDCVARLTKDRGVYVIDFKSAKAHYPENAMQVAGYRFAYLEECLRRKSNLIPIATGIGVLRLDKLTGEPDFKDYSDKYERALTSFQHLVRYYYSAKKRRLKNNPFVV